MRNQLRSLVVAGLIGAALPTSAATLTLNNVDPPGQGFNDPTPATPVAGNRGTTIGAQRLVAYRKALELWGKTLKSNVNITVRGSFAPLPCNATGAVLAQAGALQIYSDFNGAPLAGHWYHIPLANALAGFDLTPGAPDVPGPNDAFNDDVVAFFNGALGGANCLAGASWYYGLDNNAPDGAIDFLDTFMHEISHGLGFSNFANELTGETPFGLPDVYMANTLDLTNGRRWNTFSPAEIVASAVKQGQVVWAGPKVTANAAKVLGPGTSLQVFGNVVNLPRVMEVATASFGPAPTLLNFMGQVAVATDGVAAAGGGTSADACEAVVSNVKGKIAIVDRGLCPYVVKVKNAQNAGAIGVIVTNTLGRPAEPVGGLDATITIPSVMVGNADGNALRANPGATINVAVFQDPTRLQGTTQGKVRLYAPIAVSLGSSISHFDTTGSPNLLMEPFINADLRSATNLDLTPSLMQDIGWSLETLKIGKCETGVPNALPNGTLMHVAIDACLAGPAAQARFCATKVIIDAAGAGLLTPDGFGKALRCLP